MNYIKFPSNLHHVISTLLYFILRFHSVRKYFSLKCIIDLVVLWIEILNIMCSYTTGVKANDRFNINFLFYFTFGWHIYYTLYFLFMFVIGSWMSICRFTTNKNWIAIQNECYTPVDLLIFKSISDFFRQKHFRFINILA